MENAELDARILELLSNATPFAIRNAVMHMEEKVALRPMEPEDATYGRHVIMRSSAGEKQGAIVVGAESTVRGEAAEVAARVIGKYDQYAWGAGASSPGYVAGLSGNDARELNWALEDKEDAGEIADGSIVELSDGMRLEFLDGLYFRYPRAKATHQSTASVESMAAALAAIRLGPLRGDWQLRWQTVTASLQADIESYLLFKLPRARRLTE